MKENVLIFPELCHGCGGCSLVCPVGAISEVGREVGLIECGWAGNIKFAQGVLRIGEPMSPPLIKAVKSNMNSQNNVIIDSPPGTSCPVIESIKGSDICLLVTEPTPFGLYDLKLAVEMTRKINVPASIIINRCDTGNREVYKYCSSENLEILMEIPVDRKIAECYSEGKLIVDEFPKYKNEFEKLAERLMYI